MCSLSAGFNLHMCPDRKKRAKFTVGEVTALFQSTNLTSQNVKHLMLHYSEVVMSWCWIFFIIIQHLYIFWFYLGPWTCRRFFFQITLTVTIKLLDSNTRFHAACITIRYISFFLNRFSMLASCLFKKENFTPHSVWIQKKIIPEWHHTKSN